MNLQETRLNEIVRLRKEKALQEALEKKAQAIDASKNLEMEILKKTLVYKSNQLQTMTDLLMKDTNPNPKYNGTADQVKDVKAFRKRKDALGNFLGRWPKPKRDENSTTIPTKKKQMKYWNEAEELYFSPKYFGDQRQTIETNYLLSLTKKSKKTSTPNTSRKPTKKTKIEESVEQEQPVQLPSIVELIPIEHNDFPEKF